MKLLTPNSETLPVMVFVWLLLTIEFYGAADE